MATDDGVDEHGLHPIHRAARDGDVKEVERLIKAGADVEVQVNRTGMTALQIAAWANDHSTSLAQKQLEVAKVLIAAGAKVNGQAPGDHKSEALARAAESGSMDLIKYLLANDAEINPRKGHQPLYWALQKKRHDVARLLIEHGADVNAHDGRSQPLVSLAGINGDAELVGIMIDKGADPHRPEPISSAAVRGRLDVVKMYMSKMTDRQRRRVALEATMESAAASRQLHIVSFLKGKVTIRAKQRGDTKALERAVWSGDRALAEKILREEKARPNLWSMAGLGLVDDLKEELQHSRHRVHEMTGPSNYTPLHAAAANGRVEAARYLLDIGAGPSAPGTYGSTPLHLAAAYGHVELAKLLIDHGAKVSARHVRSLYVGASLSPLDAALSRGHFDVMTLLLNSGARIESDNPGFIRMLGRTTPEWRKKIVKALQNHPGETGLDAFVESLTNKGYTNWLIEAGYTRNDN